MSDQKKQEDVFLSLKKDVEKADIYNSLKKSDLFKDLSDTEISTVSLVSTLHKHPKGTTLFSQGEKASDIYVVVSGSVDVSINQGLEKKLKLGTYKKGEFFGELAFFLKEIRIGTAITNEDTTIVVINNKLYDLPSIFRTQGFVSFLKIIANRASSTLKEISKSMTRNKNAMLQFMNDFPNTSVEEEGVDKRRQNGNEFLKIGNLRNLHIFKRFDDESLEKLCAKSYKIDIEKGELLFPENSTGKSFYIIVSGAILIIKTLEINGEEKHAKIALLPPGRPLGHLSFFDNSERSASAIACERTTLMEIELETYTELVCTVGEDTDVAFELLEGFIDDLAVAMVATNRALVYASSRAGLT